MAEGRDLAGVITQVERNRHLVQTAGRRLRWAARCALAEHLIYLRIARRRYPVEPDTGGEFAAARVLREDSEFVIEGFPRCGNTFAVTAFKMSQTKPVRLANHLHAPAQIIAAVNRQIPTLVLIRDPEEAAASFMIQNNGYLSAAQVLRFYTRFYRRVLPYSSGFAMATFEEVTADFGAVVMRVNKRFATCFNVFEHTDENVRKCFDLIDEDSRIMHRGNIRELGVARPSEYRRLLRDAMVDELRAQRIRSLRDRAYDIYSLMLHSAEI